MTTTFLFVKWETLWSKTASKAGSLHSFLKQFSYHIYVLLSPPFLSTFHFHEPRNISYSFFNLNLSSTTHSFCLFRIPLLSKTSKSTFVTFPFDQVASEFYWKKLHTKLIQLYFFIGTLYNYSNPQPDLCILFFPFCKRLFVCFR